VTTRKLLDIDDLTPSELTAVLELAGDDYPPHVLAGRGVALIFQKPSARTRSSSELAVFQLGGHPVAIRADEVGIDDRESAEDVARTLAQYHSVIGARVLDHTVLVRMAAVSGVIGVPWRAAGWHGSATPTTSPGAWCWPAR
jgi:ornithine carbamoyltransferase